VGSTKDLKHRIKYALTRSAVSRGIVLNDAMGLYELYMCIDGACGTVVVKALCYKLEGRGFEFLNVPNHSGRTRPWGLLSL
jgi:hypothetical protein